MPAVFSKYLVFSLSLVLSLCPLSHADDGMLTGLPPLAVHVSTDGLPDRIGAAIAKVGYQSLELAKIPSAEAKLSVKEETSPFIHWELAIRRLDENGKALCYASTSIKITTENPYSGVPVQCSLAHAYSFRITENIDEANAFFKSYVRQNIKETAEAWRSQNTPIESSADLSRNPAG